MTDPSTRNSTTAWATDIPTPPAYDHGFAPLSRRQHSLDDAGDPALRDQARIFALEIPAMLGNVEIVGVYKHRDVLVELVNEELVKNCQQQHIRIIPWTVNEAKKIATLKVMGVDGIISDYPNLF